MFNGGTHVLRCRISGLEVPTALALVLVAGSALASGEQRIDFKRIEYQFLRLERTSKFPRDLVSRHGSPARPALGKGQEFAIVRAKATLSGSGENAQVRDAALFGDGGAKYDCRGVHLVCPESAGCYGAFVFAVPVGATLTRFELGGMPVDLSQLGDEERAGAKEDGAAR